MVMTKKQNENLKIGDLVTPDISVIWYDDYYIPHNSPVYFVDAVRDRFLVVDEHNKFRWVSTNDCELLK